MFTRTLRPAVAVARTQAVNQQQQAGMATLKEIDQRLKSVKNIGKITKVRQEFWKCWGLVWKAFV